MISYIGYRHILGGFPLNCSINLSACLFPALSNCTFSNPYKSKQFHVLCKRHKDIELQTFTAFPQFELKSSQHKCVPCRQLSYSYMIRGKFEQIKCAVVHVKAGKVHASGLSAMLSHYKTLNSICSDASNITVVCKNNILYNNIISQKVRLVQTSSSKRKPPKATKLSRRIQKILPELFIESGEPLPTTTVEKQLLGLMQMWEVDEAVELLKHSVEEGIEPDATVTLNLLQQLANLGEVEGLLEVHEFLKDRGLSTNVKFYHCLRDAYFNSGRIDEGVLMLRMIYHSRRDFDDSDLFFTLLATMTAKHFEHMLPLIESYVSDLEESTPPVTCARASLWRCLVLAEKFDQANLLLEEYPTLKKIIPAQVTKIIQSQLEVNFNRDIVLPWLMNCPLVKPGLSASVFDMLITYKSNQEQWSEGLAYLCQAMEDGRTIHQKTVETFLAKFLNQLSPENVENLSSWAAQLNNVEGDIESQSDS